MNPKYGRTTVWLVAAGPGQSRPAVHADAPALYPIADAQAGLGDTSLAQAKASRSADVRGGFRGAACTYYAQSAATWHRIAHPGRFSPSQFPSGDALHVQQQCAQCGCAARADH